VEVIVQGPEPVIIRADRIEHDQKLNLTRFTGRVSLRRGPELLTADRAIWNNQTGVAEAAGSVRLEAPDFMVEAERALVNMELSLAKIYQGRAFFARNNYYLNGTVIERLSEKKFQATEASATTCDGPTPAWTIFAEHLTVTEGGYASATGVVLKGAGSTLPFFVAPYFIFPVKTERQSGLLRPSLAVSTKDGPTVSLPLFWATGENHDLTFTPVWREKRGLASTLEGRYHQDWGRGLWQVSHLNDQLSRQYDFTLSRGHQETGERFWLRAQNQGRFGEWDVNLNLDLVSDPYYLMEFTHDPDGFDLSAKIFSSTFGHTLNEALNPNRANDLYAQKLDGSTQIRAGLHYTQNLYSKRNHDTLQRLPAIQYDLVGRSLGEAFDSGRQSPRLSLNTRYDNFYRLTDENSTNTETGHRMRLKPTVDWARSLGPANLKITGGLDMAAYSVSGRRLDAPSPAARAESGRERWHELLTGSAETELSTTFSRIFEGGPGQAVATRHQMSPTLAFNYVGAPEDQGRLPFWDHFDRRLPRQTIRYGLSNSLVAKNQVQAQDQKAEEPQAAPVDEYFQFLKFGVWSSYELADNSAGQQHERDRYHLYDANYYGQGSGPLEAHLEAFFNPYASARLISTFNTGTGQPMSHDMSLNLANDRGDRLTLTYDYDAPEAKYFQTAASHEEARGDLTMRLNSEWSANVSTRFDLKSDRALESMAKLTYQAQCYELGLIYSKTYSEQSVGLVIDLMGLGSLGY
jgi:LPS-assembly protein